MHCTQLRVVHLSRATPRWGQTLMTRVVLQSLLQAWSHTLEECRLNVDMVLEGAGYSRWRELAACHRLRVLELRLREGQPLPAELVAALQELPSFRSLALSFDGPAVCLMPPNLLTVMARSHSFSTLHLHSQIVGSPPSASFAADHCLSKMLSALVKQRSELLTSSLLSRLRVISHYSWKGVASARCYRIVKSAENPH